MHQAPISGPRSSVPSNSRALIQPCQGLISFLAIYPPFLPPGDLILNPLEKRFAVIRGEGLGPVLLLDRVDEKLVFAADPAAGGKDVFRSAVMSLRMMPRTQRS